MIQVHPVPARSEETIMEAVSRPQTLTQACADRIRDSILSGQFRPGEPLREVELSTMLGVSRGTAREALRMLAGQGIVRILTHRGAFVAELTPQVVREMCSLRALLEPYAVGLCMQSGAYSSEDLHDLEDLLDAFARYESAGDRAKVVETDAEFHRRLCCGCGHSLLLETLQRMRDQTYMYMFAVKLYRSDREPDAVAHRRLLEAVRSGDAARAQKALGDHILESGDLLLARIEALGREAAAHSNSISSR